MRFVVSPWFVDHLRHLIQDVKPALPGLLQSFGEDLIRESLNLDVHLGCCDPFLGPGHLEVHVPQVVLIAQDIGKDGILPGIRIGDQSHGNAGYRFADLDPAVHQSQCTGTYRRHGRGAIGFENIGDDPDRVWILCTGWHYIFQGPVGQVAVTDFPSADAPYRLPRWRMVESYNAG